MGNLTLLPTRRDLRLFPLALDLLRGPPAVRRVVHAAAGAVHFGGVLAKCPPDLISLTIASRRLGGDKVNLSLVLYLLIYLVGLVDVANSACNLFLELPSFRKVHFTVTYHFLIRPFSRLVVL